MNMIVSKVVIEDAEISIAHQKCSDASLYKSKGLFIESTGSKNNTISCINYNDYLDIYLFWESHSSAKSVEVLFVPETAILFIGCGEISARVCVKTNSIIGIERITLFWCFTRHKNYILEMDELQCFLYALDGKKVDEVEVDPPYETEYLENGIKFESSIFGTGWLHYN
ncbi:MAG: hypothetical protein V4732_08100 [Pseudomonadota bacterium]